MKRLFLSIIIGILFFASQSYAQNLNDLNKYIKEVQLEKEIFGQELVSAEKNSTEAIFRLTYTDSKGKSTEEEFVFDLIFFSPVLVQREASKKLITVELATAEGFDAIKYSKAEKFEKYVNKMIFRFDDVTNAKEFEKGIKAAISAAKSKFESSIKLTDSFSELQKMVEGTITSFEEQGIEVTQGTQRAGSLKDRVKLDSKFAANKKETDMSYDFSWGDLNDKAVETKAQGSIFEVEIQTNDKDDFIKITDNLKSKVEYGNSLKFYVAKPKETKILAMTLKKFLPMAKKELQNRLKTGGSPGLEALSKISTIELGEDKIEQKIEKNCMCEYSREIETKGKSKEEKYSFNFGDLTDFKMKIDKNYPVISAKTIDGQKFISLEKSDSKKSFEKEIDFYIPDLESARTLIASLPGIAKKCQQSIKPENFQWLVKTLGNEELGGITQELSASENKWELVVTTASGKKTIEKTFEFNIKDIDASKNSFEVDGQNMAITLQTKGKEKVIKVSENGKSSFAAELQIVVASAEEAKKVNATIAALSKDK
ncbi:MAG: hypothetical protein IPP61_04075 [Cytophagaceae bacterium]|nr:hypothetical protein [Cytophagaceae bacterium]MBL0301530.1 hypothetical protein [Cytophagaceae bacterium]MBL0324352.1 hypothetical protein [Cytophagaceae bacterium]